MKKIKGEKLNFFNCRNSLLPWMIGIFLLLALLLPGIVFASSITPNKLIELTNQERAKYGLAELRENELLKQAAEEKVNDIIINQKFAHNFGDKKFSQWIKDEGYQYSIVGENLAVNFTDSEPLFNAWLASPMHKKNILHEDYQEVGVATMEANWFEEETVIVVELFGTPSVMSEQLVPGTLSASPTINSPLNSSYVVASNLSEHYLNNITIQESLLPFSSLGQIEINNLIVKNKTAIVNYFLMAAKFMILYMSIMVLVVLVYLYAIYFGKLNKKLHLLSKP